MGLETDQHCHDCWNIHPYVLRITSIHHSKALVEHTTRGKRFRLYGPSIAHPWKTYQNSSASFKAWYHLNHFYLFSNPQYAMSFICIVFRHKYGSGRSSQWNAIGLRANKLHAWKGAIYKKKTISCLLLIFRKRAFYGAVSIANSAIQ